MEKSWMAAAVAVQGNSSLGFIRGKKSEFGEIQIKYYPHIKKLVFRLPELPGLPERNRNLQNLFDAFIPFLPHGKRLSIQLYPRKTRGHGRAAGIRCTRWGGSSRAYKRYSQRSA